MSAKYSKLILAGGIGLLLTAIALYVVVVKIPTDLATNVADGIRRTFNFTPEVSVNETIVIEQNTPIAELATVSREIFVDYDWSHQWLGSTKTIVLRGTFTAKAGFDLQKPYSINITRYPLRVHASLFPPKILSVQMNSYKILHDESGWWNRISDTDRESAVNALQQIARSKAESSGMLSDARTSIEQRIKEIVERNGAIVEFAHPWQEK